MPEFFDELLGEPVNLEDASEPSDIIWENRLVPNSYRKKVRCINTMIITFMLIISAGIISYLSKVAMDNKLRWPPTDCIFKTTQYHGDQNVFEPEEWK